MINYIQPNWKAPANIRAYTTIRHSWGGRQSDHQTANEKLKSLLHLPKDPFWLKQTHSTIVVSTDSTEKEPEGDASFTQSSNQVCVILTADCLPILICNQQGTQVAAIHAGWRGLANGIIESTLKALNQSPDDLLVWLGPAIGPKRFEVGLDVYEAFTQQHSESMGAFKPQQEGKWLANLYELARVRLTLQGISKITGGEFCTYTQDDLFFSYRRDKGKTGRMASLIWIAE